MFLKQLQVGHMVVFAYILGDTESGEGLVVDPAYEADTILAEAAKHNITIKYIVNTHGHIDHIGGNADMKEQTGADIIIHEADAHMLGASSAAKLQIFQVKQSPAADITVRDGDIISIGSIRVTVLHTPGHTPGCISLSVPGYVCTGDTLFVGGVGRTDLPGGSPEALSTSIREKLLTLPDDTIVLPGHNYGHTVTSTIGYEKKHNPYLQ
jgi:glyoxylase-like metal-dependent hydrolase (beta-lactamase superfamily II)